MVSARIAIRVCAALEDARWKWQGNHNASGKTRKWAREHLAMMLVVSLDNVYPLRHSHSPRSVTIYEHN